MCFDRDNVVSVCQLGGRHEHLGGVVVRRGVARSSVSAGRVADGVRAQASAVHLGTVDVDNGAIIGQVPYCYALERGHVGDCEVRSEVAGHGT